MSNVPKLRFKEFSGEWEEKKLSKLTKVYDGTHSTPKYVEEGIPFYSVEHVTANQFKNTKYIAEDVFEKENKRVKLETNDILMTRIGDIGTSRLLDWDVNASFYVSLALIKQSDKFVSSFLNQQIKSNNFQSQLYSRTLHVAFPKKINLGEIGECHFYLPSKQEQEKIASFLTSVDSKIEQLTKKEELLQQYKKGVLQKIFNQEIRFKADDGSEFCEWEEKKLGQIGKFHAGGDLTKLNYSKEKSNEYVYPIYANGSGEGLYGYATTFQYKSNCVTVSGRGTLGHANLRKENFNAIVRLIVIEPKSNICGNFLKEAINRINFSIESTGVPQLTIPQISLYKVFLPCLEEQNKIAIFLSSIDTKIEQTQKQLELSKEFKKALLQQIFV